MEAPVIPAKAGIQSVDGGFPKVCGVDSCFHGNDFDLRRPSLANDTSTGQQNRLTGILYDEKIAIMHKAPPILLLTLWILGGAINAAQQIKLNPTAMPRSVCALVTKAEIEQAIGTTIGKGMAGKAGKDDVCAYTNSKGTKVKIVISRSQAKRDLTSLVDKAKKALPNAKVREFPGLGEKALLVEIPKGDTMLSVYRGGDALVVSVNGIGEGAKAHAAVEKIARKAFSRF